MFVFKQVLNTVFFYHVFFFSELILYKNWLTQKRLFTSPNNEKQKIKLDEQRKSEESDAKNQFSH